MAWQSFNLLMDRPRILVLDARPASLYAAGHIRGSICVELNNRTLRSLAGPGPPTWHPNCWWDRHVLLVVSPAASRKRKAAGHQSCTLDSSSRHPVYTFLEEEGLVKSLQLLQTNEGEDDPFSSFARAYPFLITKSAKVSEFKNYPNEIVPGLLFLGDITHAQNNTCLENLNISHVLTIHTERMKLPKTFVHMFLELEDSSEADIKQYFEPMYEFVERARSAQKRVLVHCGAGVSRSATLCAAYLIRTNHWRVEEALKFLKEQRSKVNPNSGFLGALHDYSCSLPNDVGKVNSDPLWHLDIMKDGKCVGNILLSKKQICFGRGLDCAVTLDHASVSRQHALLTRARDADFQLVDNSTHGTFVNGVALSKKSPIILEVGDIIQFGASSRKYILCNKDSCNAAVAH